MDNLEKIKQATWHAREATRLLNSSKALREARAEGVIDGASITAAVEKLNALALEEMEKFLALADSLYPSLKSTIHPERH